MASRQLDLLAGGAKSANKSSKSGSKVSSNVRSSAGGSGRGGKRGGTGGGDDAPPPTPPADASLASEAQRRYLNYAVSVITSRALPDVRDGLKPVQRRILYSMYANLHLYPDSKHRKSATIVGDVLGKFHPHGDTSCYDAMVRMAQPFSMREMLVDGHGNFGSLDGDPPAAYRYTEARLAPLAIELLDEIKQGTVDFRPNYDGTTEEPIVLPAKIPHLLVNGCTGHRGRHGDQHPAPQPVRGVRGGGRADRRPEARDQGPPEVHQGARLSDRRPGHEQQERAARHLRDGAGGRAGARRMEERIGREGRPTRSSSRRSRSRSTKSTVVERIAEVIINKKLPMLVDVRDESTDDVRIVLELKPGGDPNLVMAYLFKHTPLETGFHVNLTCLVPTENKEIAGPVRLDLAAMLREFIDFRQETVRRRFEFELAELQKRIHILEGFAKIFDALDEAMRIIRKSDGKSDAAVKLSARFKLSDLQTDAILELKLYKLARLEIEAILEELKAKRARAKEIQAILDDKRKLMRVVRGEIAEVAARFPDKRRTKIGGAGGEDMEFVAEDFIVDEEVHRHRDAATAGSKRVREVKDLSATRLRDGDAILAVMPRLDEGADGGLLEPRLRVRRCASTTCRRRPATASRCRSCSTSATASASSARCR